VDTNVVGVDPPLAGNAMQRLLDASRQGNVRVAVPRLVVLEAANAWAYQVDEQLDEVAKASSKLESLGYAREVPARPSVGELRQQKHDDMTVHLKAAGVSFPEFPPAEHETVVHRALCRSQPFDAGGKDGYRDTLLWETVLGRAASEDVIFVSRDVRAFFASKTLKSLSPALAAEAIARSGRKHAVRVFYDLDEALNETVRLTQEQQARKAQAEADGNVKRRLAGLLDDPDTLKAFSRRMRSALLNAEFGWDDVRALLPHRQTRDLDIDRVEDIADVKVIGAHQLSDRITAELTARMLISVDVHLPAAVAASIDEDDALVWEGSDGWGDARASALRTVLASFEATFDRDLNLTALRLRRLSRTRR
jgi:hypothetical protein